MSRAFLSVPRSIWAWSIPSRQAEVEVEPQVLQLGPVERRHVDGEPDLAAAEEVGQQPRGLDGDADLRLLGRGPEVRRDQHLTDA